jgi:cephalosporin-C deacetylase-like acetyl esterase
LYNLRDREIAKLKTTADWVQRQQVVRNKLMKLVGPFPEKTALNPVVTGIIKKKGYRIEKIIYESMPNFYVTACLFIPDDLIEKAPAVLNVIGHEQESFRAELDQVIILNLVKKGIVVLAIDPLGQGEHVQYFDPKLKCSSIGYSVIEHCYFGNQCFLSGVSSARYFIWDGIRAIDYLVSRAEVDAKRIGVTGFSGGGTITSYLGAFDDRVQVAVPSSWSTASQRQLETKGAQDAEATLLNSLAEGITFEDLIEVRAPKPTLLTFVSRDEYLCMQGAREAFVEAGRAYDAFGKKNNLALVEDDSRHWLTPKIRLAIYSFFMDHFNLPGDPTEEDVEILSEEELTVTTTGQIATSLGGNMVFDMNKKETEKLIANLLVSRKDFQQHLDNVSVKAKEISGYSMSTDYYDNAFIKGRYQRGGYTVAKYALAGDGDYVIPILLFVPADNLEKHPAIIYLHPQGKITDANKNGEIEKLLQKGYIVAAADVLGVGETRNTAARGLADGYTGALIGKSVVGIQAGDISRVVSYLKHRDDVDPTNIGAVGFDSMCLPLLHAAAFDSSIKNLILVRSLISYRSVAMNRFYKIGLTPNEGGGTGHPYEVDFSWGIAGVLKAYDLPDLIASIAPRKIALVDLQDQLLDSAAESLIDEELKFPRAVYGMKSATHQLKIDLSFDLMSLVDWAFHP